MSDLFGPSRGVPQHQKGRRPALPGGLQSADLDRAQGPVLAHQDAVEGARDGQSELPVAVKGGEAAALVRVDQVVDGEPQDLVRVISRERERRRVGHEEPVSDDYQNGVERVLQKILQRTGIDFLLHESPLGWTQGPIADAGPAIFSLCGRSVKRRRRVAPSRKPPAVVAELTPS